MIKWIHLKVFWWNGEISFLCFSDWKTATLVKEFLEEKTKVLKCEIAVSDTPYPKEVKDETLD